MSVVMARTVSGPSVPAPFSPGAPVRSSWAPVR